MTDDERKTYEAIDFDTEEYREQIGTNELLYEGENTKVDTLTHRWRYPSLSIHGTYYYYLINPEGIIFDLFPNPLLVPLLVNLLTARPLFK